MAERGKWKSEIGGTTVTKQSQAFFFHLPFSILRFPLTKSEKDGSAVAPNFQQNPNSRGIPFALSSSVGARSPTVTRNPLCTRLLQPALS
jgi:hypothetical protein